MLCRIPCWKWAEMGRGVMPRHSCYNCWGPLVRIMRMLQSIGIPKRFQILAKRSASTKDEVVASAFSSSTGRESIPGDFPFFIALIAVSTSAWEGGLHVVNVQIIRRVPVRRLIKLWLVKHFFEMLDPSCSQFLFSCHHFPFLFFVLLNCLMILHTVHVEASLSSSYLCFIS